jgi:uncharacterized protein (DUF58 family)
VFEERFDVQNESRIPRLWVEIRDDSTLPGSRGSRVLTGIRGKERRSYLVRTWLVQRGVFTLGPTALASGDIFGLSPVNRSVPAQDSLLVFPPMVNVNAFPNPPGLLPGGDALRLRTHQVTPNAAGVREYAPGDALNRIHWMSTARRDQFMVKEFELDPLADVWIFLDAEQAVQATLPHSLPSLNVDDLWQHASKIPLPPSTEEYSVSIAASLARYFLRRGRAVGLASAGQHLTLLPPDRSGRQLGKILEALALSRAVGVLPLRGLVTTQARHLPRGSTVILITPSVNDEVVLMVDFIARSGLRPIAVLLDAASFGGPPGSDAILGKIKTLGVPVRCVVNGDNLEQALSAEMPGGMRHAGGGERQKYLAA